MNILKAGRHTVIGGLAQSNAAGIGREFLFDALASGHRPTIISINATRRDDELRRHFSVWAKARKRQISAPAIFGSEALVSARDPDHFFSLVDRAWQLRPSPAPIFFRDMSGQTYAPDRWFAFAAELARTYNAPVLSVVNLGAHPLTAIPILDVAADDHWTCEDGGGRVMLKFVQRGDILEFTSKAVDGGQVWNAEHREVA